MTSSKAHVHQRKQCVWTKRQFPALSFFLCQTQRMESINLIRYDTTQRALYLESAAGCERLLCSSLQNGLEQLCLREGSTLAGRMNAMDKCYCGRSGKPLLLCAHPFVCFLPSTHQKDRGRVYFNVSRVVRLRQEQTKTRWQVRFVDGMECAIETKANLQRAVLKTMQMKAALTDRSLRSTRFPSNAHDAAC